MTFLLNYFFFYVAGCGGSLTSTTGSIHSPNYPQAYGRNGECFWKIAVSLGNTIQLTIIDIDLEVHESCLLDYIEIYDGINRKAPRLGRYCSSNYPLNIYSKTNHLYIRFRSDSTKQGRGFHLKFHTGGGICITHFITTKLLTKYYLLFLF